MSPIGFKFNLVLDRCLLCVLDESLSVMPFSVFGMPCSSVVDTGDKVYMNGETR
jgi:hypothetical protein